MSWPVMSVRRGHHRRASMMLPPSGEEMDSLIRMHSDWYLSRYEALTGLRLQPRHL